MVTPILLATSAALVWGTSDFCGGKGAQRAHALTVTVISQLAALPLLAVGLLAIPGVVRVADLGWGMVAGAAGLVGVLLLYRGLAGGAMVVVSPVTAVTAAVVPLLVGLVTDGGLHPLGLLGSACAIGAIGLVSAGPSGSARIQSRIGRLVGLALLAGTMFGIFFIIVGQAHPDSGLWVLVGARLSSIPLGLLLLARRGLDWRLPRTELVWAVLAGTLDLTGNVLFLLAAMDGHLSLVAVLASLYPASTVLLALTVDRERVRGTQLLGLGLAAAALVLTAS